ncbi:MAG TPA: condensation domain-containing protein, partial [Chthonomonadales bacterium]|nr:condensation domain-containing protein [Chthonomonadales bacterium]
MAQSPKPISELSPEQRAALELRLLGNRPVRPPAGAIPRRQQGGTGPLSYGQLRLWLLERLAPGGHAYHIPRVLRLLGDLDVDAMQRAIAAVVERHEVLRTIYLATDDEPLQSPTAKPNLALPLTDLSHLPAGQQEVAWRDLVDKEIEEPFQLDRDAMLRAAIIRLAEKEHLLVLVMHHIASDGWSMGILFRELAALYGAFLSGGANPLEPLPIQYADYAAWQRSGQQAEAHSRSLDYWKERLAGGVPQLQLPFDRPRPPIETHNGAVARKLLPLSVMNAAGELSRASGATMFMTLLAAYQAVLYRFSDQEDFVVGTPVAGRTRTETEGLIGFFINTLPLRSEVRGNISFRALLERVKESALAGFARQEAPYEKLVSELNPERDLGVNPIFQVMFSVQNIPKRLWRLPGLEVEPLDMDSGAAKLDLSLTAVETAEGLRIGLTYNCDLFEAATAERIVNGFARLLEAAVASPDAPISDLPVMSEAEQQVLLE